MKRIVMLWLSLTLATLSCATSAQIIDQVTFTGIEPSTPLSDIDETRSFTVNNSGEVSSLLFSGTIAPIDVETTSSFASDFAFNVSGPNIQINQAGFSQTSFLAEATSFEGSIAFTGSIEEGDIITFDFVDLFDDGSALTNAVIDVTFEFSEGGFVLEPFEIPELPEGIDQVIFTGIETGTTDNTRTFTPTNSGTANLVFFSGRITSLSPGAFPSGFEFDINGSDFSISFLRTTELFGGFQTFIFEGFIGISGTISEGDSLIFNFDDTFGDNLENPNAVIDIAFVFLNEPNDLNSTISDLGNFTLDEGFYDRNSEDGINDHPFTTVEFEVSANGIYSIESIWGFDSFGNQFDGFLYIFNQTFDGIDDSNNIAFNDDFSDIEASRIDNLILEKGVVYTALLTSFESEAGNSNLQGNLRVLSTEANTASLVEEEAKLCFPIKSQDNNIVMICL